MSALAKPTVKPGDRFGSWIVAGVPFRTRRTSGKTGGETEVLCVCRCDCGTVRPVLVRSISRGVSMTCGCEAAAKASTLHKKHGLSEHGAYTVWHGMKARCYSPANNRFYNYGARGISVCREWLESPAAFVAWAVANGWEPGLQIDRIDNDGNYEPSNCRFVTPSQNCQNRRPRKKAVL